MAFFRSKICWAICVGCIAPLLGCGSAPSAVGTWEFLGESCEGVAVVNDGFRITLTVGETTGTLVVAGQGNILNRDEDTDALLSRDLTDPTQDTGGNTFEDPVDDCSVTFRDFPIVTGESVIEPVLGSATELACSPSDCDVFYTRLLNSPGATAANMTFDCADDNNTTTGFRDRLEHITDRTMTWVRFLGDGTSCEQRYQRTSLVP